MDSKKEKPDLTKDWVFHITVLILFFTIYNVMINFKFYFFITALTATICIVIVIHFLIKCGSKSGGVIAMGHVNMNNDETCTNCFFGDISYGKPVSKEGETPDWCWRFNFKTKHDGYCKDEYFENMQDGGKKYGKCSPEIAGYVIRKKDFDKEEKKKSLINIMGILAGVILGFLLTIFLINP